MIDEQSKVKWENYKKEFTCLQEYGAKKGYIKNYSPELLKELSKYEFGGIPADVLVQSTRLLPLCTDREKIVLLLLALKEENCQIINADINSISLNPSYIDFINKNNRDVFGQITYVLVKEDGKEYVYDVTRNLVYLAKYFNKIENPQHKLITNRAIFLDHYLNHSEEDKPKYPILNPLINSLIVKSPFKEKYFYKSHEEITRGLKNYLSTLKARR